MPPQSVGDQLKAISNVVEEMNKRLINLEKVLNITRLTTGYSGYTKDQSPVARTSISFDDFAKQLRASVENLNNQVREGISQIMIDQMEVELKTGLDFTDKVKLNTLLPQELKPEGLSTLRFTLRPVTTLKLPD